VNEAFTADHLDKTGKRVKVNQSHGGSSSQSRAVIDGLAADVVTLALWSDIDAVRKNGKGLIADGWEKRLPNDSLPWTSTIVFVVRQGNPHGVKDWPDLVNGDVKVITPNPKTSGNGRLSFLAAYGSVKDAGGDDAAAEEYVRKLYARVPVLDTGARGATVTFIQKNIGDVHLTWENEAHHEVKEAKGKAEIVYPPSSIRAEPPVAAVDGVVTRRGTRELAEAYLKFLYTPPAQEIIAKHYYRPVDEKVLGANRERFPAMKLFAVTATAKDWDDAQRKFFDDGGVFDRVYQAKGE
jgi:sulfate transport system substrate-binding protein